MTSSKNPVREFIEILRRIRTGHENLKVSSGIPGFIPGTGERVDAFSTALPWESATPDGLFTLKGDKPENPEGLGFAIEIFPQTGVTRRHSSASRLRLKPDPSSRSRPSRRRP